jgi:hypothetical protein
MFPPWVLELLLIVTLIEDGHTQIADLALLTASKLTIHK